MMNYIKTISASSTRYSVGISIKNQYLQGGLSLTQSSGMFLRLFLGVYWFILSIFFYIYLQEKKHIASILKL